MNARRADEDATNLARVARQRASLTQLELAALCRVNRVTVAGWESGRKPPSGTAAALLWLVATHPRLVKRELRREREDRARLLDELARLLTEAGRTSDDVGEIEDDEITFADFPSRHDDDDDEIN